MVKITKLTLDVLKPLEPNLIEFSKGLGSLKGVKNVELVVQEIDRKTETIKAIIEGNNLDFEKIRKRIEDLGGAIHSVDEVTVEK